MVRRTQPQHTAADLPPEKAYASLKAQLEALQKLKGRSYIEASAAENEWGHLTEKLMIRTFGSNSANMSAFYGARSAGDFYITPFGGGEDHGLNQQNFSARIQAYEGMLNSALAELKLDLPETEIKGVYEPGQEYEFYRSVKSIIGLASTEIFVIDPYISSEMFDVYADAISRAGGFRLLSSNIPSAVITIGQKYASGGNFQFRRSNAIHDRVLFADNRVWLCGNRLRTLRRGSLPTSLNTINP